MANIDIRPAIGDKINQWSGVDLNKVMESLTEEDVLARTVFIGNATARMQVPVHNHGWWRGGNVGYDPNNKRLITQTFITRALRFASGATPTDRTIYTVSADKTFYLQGVAAHNDAAGGDTIIALSDGGVATPADGTATTNNKFFRGLRLGFPQPVICNAGVGHLAEFTTSVVWLATSQTASQGYTIQIWGFEEET